MAAYLIGQVIVIDKNQFAPYVQRTSTLIAQHGGQLLDVVRAVETIEGDWPVGALTALVRFSDEASLRAFWNSPQNFAFSNDCSLIETCKLNGVEPYAYLHDVLTRMVDGHPVNRLDELLPWVSKPEIHVKT
jgi:uncharacterized protein (DUF1330 family)